MAVITKEYRTVKQVVGGVEEAVVRTTPEAIDLQTSFGRMVNAPGAAAAPSGAPAQPIAEAVQPAPVGLCPVRRWPWESGGAVGAGTS